MANGNSYVLMLWPCDVIDCFNFPVNTWHTAYMPKLTDTRSNLHAFLNIRFLLQWKTCLYFIDDRGVRQNTIEYVRIFQKIHRVSVKKTCHFNFLNNSVKHWPILIIFGKQHQEETWRKQLYFSPPHLITVSTLLCEMQKSKFGCLQQWIHTGERMRQLRKSSLRP